MWHGISVEAGLINEYIALFGCKMEELQMDGLILGCPLVIVQIGKFFGTFLREGWEGGWKNVRTSLCLKAKGGKLTRVNAVLGPLCIFCHFEECKKKVVRELERKIWNLLWKGG